MRRPWWTIGAAASAIVAWLVVGSAIFGPDEPRGTPAISAALAPMVALALLLTVAAARAARRRPPRADRGPLWLAAGAGVLLTSGLVWGWSSDVREANDEAYGVPIALALVFGLPAAALWAVGARRFAQAPERVREPLPGRVRRGWREARKAWRVAWQERGLLVLPAASMTLAAGVWIAAFTIAGSFTERFTPRLVLTTVLVLLPGSLVGGFFGVAYVAALDCRLRGRPAGAGAGLAIAWRRRGPIAGWAVLSAGVGALLQALQQLRSEWVVLPLLSWLAGAAWTVLATFAIPVIALEDTGVRATVRRAAEVVRGRWGEGVGSVGNLVAVGAVGGALFGLMVSLALALAAFDDRAFAVAVGASAVLFLVAVTAFGVVGHVVALALYRLSVNGDVVGAFTAEDLDHALTPRRRLRLRRRRP